MSEAEYLTRVARRSRARLREAVHEVGGTLDQATGVQGHIRRHPILWTSLAAGGGALIAGLLGPGRLVRRGAGLGVRAARLILLRNFLDALDE